MQCISPIYINREGQRLFVPCGKCNFCLQRRRQDWSFRLEDEYKRCERAYFITLTYEDENLPIAENGIPTLNKSHLQLFFKRLRKDQETHEKKNGFDKWKIKYYACGEYGTQTHRPHYHIIIFNVRDRIIHNIAKHWGLGEQVRVENANEKTIAYTTKYVINQFNDDYKGIEKPFALMSKGLGESYKILNESIHKKNKQFFTTAGGVRRPLPRYYVDKYFTKYERQKNARNTQKEMDELYKKEIEKIAFNKFHPEPEMYISEKTRYKHDAVKNKANKNNTF